VFKRSSTARVALLGSFGLLLSPTVVLAADAAHPAPLDLPAWTVVPFVLLLLSIAVLPLWAEHWWHANRNKAAIALLFGGPVALYLLFLPHFAGQNGAPVLGHVMLEYVSFMVLLGSLYTVAGGIVLEGDIEAHPVTNTAFLALGALLANVMGTTGASMLLIRPVLRINKQRKNTAHLPIFFIFVVSNLGGLLTPLGDPPLFLGFLRGVDFFWTLQLWPQWLMANGIVLTIFLVWDSIAYGRETKEAVTEDVREVVPLRMRGLVNFVFLVGIVAAALLRSPAVGGPATQWLGQFFPCPDLTQPPFAEGAMVLMGLLSLLFTSRTVREANQFGWGPIVEVAVLFAGIFVTMVPALELLARHGPKFGITEPWQYFWLTGALSSFLDNAPTYLTFATMASGEKGIASLVESSPTILAAISCGAVFMGANTYIGNGPNFMVKAICDEVGYKTPSFFGYMLFSGLILLPTFALITVVFFRP
jgi:Na+/H+ antiporter NhaD/arsenite permease-like protein